MLNSLKAALAAIVLSAVAPPAIAAPTSSSNFFKTSDGVRIHYLESGSGRPIVFIPGWTMPAWIWQKQIDEFSKNYRVIAVDPRSQGESDKPSYGHLPEQRARDYKELVDHLGLKQPVFVGWSMACGELIKYVELFGTGNVAGLVIVDGFITDKFSPEMFAFLSGFMNQLQQERQMHANSFVRTMFKKPQPEDYLNRLVNASIQVPADTAAVIINNMVAIMDYSAGLLKIDRPFLFAYQPQTQAGADFLKSQLGDKVRLERFEDEGHALFADNPEKFNRVLADFLQGLPK
jgi:non-heme chloroperoxidase